MKFSHIGLLATTIASAFAESVARAYNLKLFVEYLPQNVNKDGYEPVNGKFLQAVKVDPDTYLFVLGDADEAATISLDHYQDLAFIKDDQGIYYITHNETLGLSAITDFSKQQSFYLYTSNLNHTVRNYVSVGIYYSFVPTKDVGDPINYSKDHYALVHDSYEDAKGALIQYEFVGTDTGNGTGILNPSSITDAIKSSNTDITLATDFYTGVSTTNPPTTAATTGTETVEIYDENEFGYSDESEVDGGAATADGGEDDGSTSATETETASETGSSLAPKPSGGSSHAAATASDASSSKSESASSKSASDSGSSEAKTSSSGSSKPSSSASSSSNNGNGKLVAGGVGFLALIAAVL